MTTIRVTINDTQVRNMLRRAPRKIDSALTAGLEDASTHVLRIMKTYPTQRRGSTYRRTNTLKRSWKRRVDSRGRLSGLGSRVRAIIDSDGSIAPYNRFVQDRDVQARVHRGRWTNTAQGVVEREARTVVNMIDNRLRIALR